MWQRWLTSPAAALLDFVAPPMCLVCGSGLVSEGAVCATCRPKLDAADRRRACERCGAPVGPYLPTRPDCSLCRGETYHFEGTVRHGVYTDELRALVLAAKSDHGTPHSRLLADLLWGGQGATLQAWGPTLVVPIPAHRWTRMSQWQSAPEEMAVRLAARLGVPVARRALAKVKRTPKQATLSGAERRKLLYETYRALRLRRLDGARVLLVDDVMTTGRTASVCAKALKEAGSSAVLVAVAARATGEPTPNGP